MILITFQIGICVLKVLAMSFKVITVVELEGMPKGSVLQNCISVIDKNNDALCWSGLWCSMYGSYHVLVKQEGCEIWDEEKHDPTMWVLKKHFEEKAKVDRLSPVLSDMCKQLTKE